MTAPRWLIRPIAHRGLHEAASGIIENTCSAFQAAIDAGYAIECDVQEAGDGVPMVFHDSRLDRLTTRTGPLDRLSANELRHVAFKDTSDHMQSLHEVLEQVDGRVPLLIEVKSRWKVRGNFEARIGACLASYDGPAAVMSFDPYCMAAFKAQHPTLMRGLLASKEWSNDEVRLGLWQRLTMRYLLYSFMLRPHFIAYDIKALPALAPIMARHLAGLPLLTWTVRTPEQRRTAQRWTDAMIFEGFRP